MWRRVGFVALWVVATLVATTVALAAVRSVAGQVVDTPDSQLLGAGSATTVVGEVPEQTASSSTVSPTTTAPADPTTTLGSTTTTSAPEHTTTPPPSSTAAPPSSSTTGAPSVTAAPPPPSSTTSTTLADGGDEDNGEDGGDHDDDDDGDDGDDDKAEDTSTSESPPKVETKTYQLVGGWVRITYAPGIVNLDGAGPNPGFTMDIDSSGPNKVELDFEGEDEKSEFQATWSGSELDIQIDEDDD